jgi:hypothetical protein
MSDHPNMAEQVRQDAASIEADTLATMILEGVPESERIRAAFERVCLLLAASEHENAELRAARAERAKWIKPGLLTDPQVVIAACPDMVASRALEHRVKSENYARSQVRANDPLYEENHLIAVAQYLSMLLAANEIALKIHQGLAN